MWFVIERRTALLVLSIVLLINIGICSSDIDSEKYNFLVLINRYRQENGLAPLKISNALTIAAQLHSEDMASHNYFSHTSLDGRTFVDRIRAAGYTYNTLLGENIAAGFDTAQKVFDAWKSSSGHNANMLNSNYVVIGIGLAYNASSTYKYYWTTDFGGYDDSGTSYNSPPNVPSIPSGPSVGFSGTPYSFSTSSTDPDGDQVKYTFDWGDGTYTTTDFKISGSTASASHSWSKAGTYKVKVMATDINGGVSDWSPAATIEIENAPPSTSASPSGTTSCLPNRSYEYKIYAYDPDGEKVRCIFDWGDGTTTESEVKDSGSFFTASHMWSRLGTFYVKVKAIDSAGKESSWSQPLIVFVKFSSNITISISATTIAREERLIVNGTIIPPHASTITVTYIRPDGSWFTIQVLSDQEGKFQDYVNPNLVGIWGLRASWNGDEDHFGSSTVQISFKVDPALCNITFESNVAGLSIIVDGANYSIPQSFRWLEGTVHTVILERVRKFTTEGRYIFRMWNDGCVESSRSILVKDPSIYRAIYSIQYLVLTKMEPNSSWNENWYDLNSVVRLSVNSTVISQGKDTRLIFDGWSNNINDTTIEVIIDGPVSIEAQWKKQFLFQINSIYGQVEGYGWYDEGSEVSFCLYPPMIDCGNGTRRVFTSWYGEGAGSYSGNELNWTFVILGPVNESAQWITQYLVSINSTHGNPLGSGWYNEFELANISIEPVIYLSNTTRFIFKSWNGSVIGQDTNMTFVVNSPANITTVWQKEFYLNLSSEYGTTWGDGWYREGSNVSFGVIPPQPSIVGYVFDGWVGDVNALTLNATVLMDGPKSLSARWHRDYSKVIAIFVVVFVCSMILIYKKKK